MTGAATVLLAMELLGRSAGTFPPVELIDARPPEASWNAEAFVRRNPDAIYLITSTTTFQAARRGDTAALRKLASILVHEEWHLRHGSDEEEAYFAQLMALTQLGSGPGTSLHTSVKRAMASVVRSRRDGAAAGGAPRPSE